MNGADGRSVDIGILSGQPLHDLGRSPARLLLLQVDNQGLDLKRQLVGMPIRPAAAVGQTLKAAVIVTPQDLVAGLARDAELPAQPGHLVAVQQPRHKLQPFIHLVTLLPRHFALLAKGQKCNLCRRNILRPRSQEGHWVYDLETSVTERT
jgi:hypothetical protein